MPAQVVLALDQGTTSSRAIAFDRDGVAVGHAQREFRQIYPQPGWVEHDPREIWESQLAVAREALDDAGVAASDVAAIGISNQRETAVVWDRATGAPVGNAIVWQDRRTASFCDELERIGVGSVITERTGLRADPYFAGTKVRWILDHIDGVRARADAGDLCFGTVDSWLIWNLTGGRHHVTDATNAGRTMLFDIHKMAWDSELARHLAVPQSMLPKVVPSSGVVAETNADILGQPVPIAGVAGDQHAALFGQACHSPGMGKNTYGTGCFLLLHTGDQPKASQNGLLTTLAWQIGDTVEYALEGGVFIGGAVVQWLRDGLEIIENSAAVEALAAEVPDNGGVYLVPAFAGLGAPHWDPYARGAVMGITRGTTKAHLARAALEGIAFQSHDLVRAMEKDAGFPMAELRVDGGASLNSLLMQFQADILDVPVVRPKISETTALGAAFLAGLAVGFWPDRQTLAAIWHEDARFNPTMPPNQVNSLLTHWTRSVEATRNWTRE